MATGDVLELNVEMDWQGVTSEQVMVRAQARGQMSAINQQHSCNWITIVVSSDRIQWVDEMHTYFRHGLQAEHVSGLDLRDVTIPAPRADETAYSLTDTQFTAGSDVP